LRALPHRGRHLSQPPDEIRAAGQFHVDFHGATAISGIGTSLSTAPPLI
jgi:hypothetical protein